MAEGNGESLLIEVETRADGIVTIVQVSLLELHLTGGKRARDGGLNLSLRVGRAGVGDRVGQEDGAEGLELNLNLYWGTDLGRGETNGLLLG